MVGHPSLSPKAAAEMVKYIYTFAEEKPKPRRLEPTGTLTLKAPAASATDGAFYLMASYTDKGTPATKPLSASALQVLKSPRIQAENYDGFSNTFTSVKIIGKLEDGDSRYLGEIQNRAFIYFKDLDLTHVGQLGLQYASVVPGTVVEARLNSAKGDLIGSVELPVTADSKDWQQAQLPLKAVSGKQTIYLVFLNANGSRNILNLDWIYFKPAMLEASSKESTGKADKNIKSH
jgi:cytochrome c